MNHDYKKSVAITIFFTMYLFKKNSKNFVLTRRTYNLLEDTVQLSMKPLNEKALQRLQLTACYKR